MEVSTANQKTHVVNGSSIVTRRRATFSTVFPCQRQASIHQALPGSDRGYGSGFQFALSYNASERMHVNIPPTTTCPTRRSAGPLPPPDGTTTRSRHNLTYLQNFTIANETPSSSTEWSGQPDRHPVQEQCRNESVRLFQYKKGKNTINLPTTPAPVSLQAWANGEPSSSQGPPAYEPNVVRVMYTRFFFNSSRVVRHDQFTAQCAAAASSANAVCSTEDYTLRTSTPFDLVAVSAVQAQEDQVLGAHLGCCHRALLPARPDCHCGATVCTSERSRSSRRNARQPPSHSPRKRRSRPSCSSTMTSTTRPTRPARAPSRL